MPSTTRVNESSSDPTTSSALVISPPGHHEHHLLMEMSRQYFFLTIPGVIRLIQILLSGLNLGYLGYLSTFYDKKVEEAISPIFLANMKEAFFLIANCNTFLTAFYIIIASMISVRSHSALLGSLFIFMFDFIQLFLVASATVNLILLYMYSEATTIYGSSLNTRQGLVVTGMLLACLHLIGCIYDLGIYIRRTETFPEPSELSFLQQTASVQPASRRSQSQEQILS